MTFWEGFLLGKHGLVQTDSHSMAHAPVKQKLHTLKEGREHAAHT